MSAYRYPAEFTPAEEGGFVVTFPDVPEAITQGETVEECIKDATDALDEALTGRINSKMDIPRASSPHPGQYLISVPMQTALKAALYEEVTKLGWSKVGLASRLGVDEREVRRLLDPHHRCYRVARRSARPQIGRVSELKEFAPREASPRDPLVNAKL